MHSVSMCQSGHSRLQLDHLAIHGEPSVPVMVDGLRILLRRVNPGFSHFQDEEVELVDETGIDYLAFEVGEALGYQRRHHTSGRDRRQTEPLEFIHIPS